MGLGNQLFQYSFVLYISDNIGQRLLIDSSIYSDFADLQCIIYTLRDIIFSKLCLGFYGVIVASIEVVVPDIYTHPTQFKKLKANKVNCWIFHKQYINDAIKSMISSFFMAILIFIFILFVNYLY